MKIQTAKNEDIIPRLKDENTKNTWWQKWYEWQKLHEWHKWQNDMNDKNYFNNKKELNDIHGNGNKSD